MATTLNAGTSTTGAAISADTSGILQLQSGSTPTTALTIDASQVASFTNNLGTVAGYPAYQCRAWCNFNGTLTGTNPPRAGGNVSTVQRVSAGTYVVTFSTAMPDANYAVALLGGNIGNSESYCITSPTTTTVQLNLQRSGTGPVDAPIVSVAIFR